MQQPIVLLLAGLLAAQTLITAPRLQATDRLDKSVEMEDRNALELGYRVLAVREAIQHPEAPHSLDAITDLGRDQRYYVMVRGWLAYQRQGDMSIVAASGGQAPEPIRRRIRFLDQAIGAIDLE
jgi:hypothetical protein